MMNNYFIKSEHRPAAQPAQPPAPTQSTPANKPKPAAGGY